LEGFLGSKRPVHAAAARTVAPASGIRFGLGRLGFGVGEGHRGAAGSVVKGAHRQTLELLGIGTLTVGLPADAWYNAG
jgi:hypothetical protein